ncbi:MAG: metallophosphoesterase [Myxococcales bacterium]|nr:metallophosphoesterase [Myxococcales bacterium]
MGRGTSSPAARLVAAAVVLLVSPATAFAAPASPPPGALSLGPYVQDLRSDGFTVAFETAADVVAEVRAGSIVAATRGTRHEAVLRGLEAGTRVPYRVFVGGHDAGGGEVALGSDRPILDFVVYGDTRNGDDRAAELVRAISAQHPDLLFHTGDFSPHGGDLVGWLGFFSGEAALLRDIPLYPVLGNHEIYRDPSAVQWRRFFIPPDGGRERFYYAFRQGPAEFIILDGNHPAPAQTAWLSARLEAARSDGVRHVFVVEHQPPLSLGDHCGSAVEQADWVALFEAHRARVRAVFAGHDHAYERMERRGVRYFVSGGGGAPTYKEQEGCAPFDHAARRVYRAVHHIVKVHVDGNNVEVAALQLDGTPIDTTRITVGEPAFAMDAPSLIPGARRSTPTWTLAGGAAIFFLLGIFLRRRRPR